MKKIIFLMCLIFPAEVLAQYEPPGARLSPYEAQRYGGSLWEVPREPYQSQYRLDRFNSQVYNLPESVIRERFQNRMQWERQQADISGRAGQF